MAPTRSTMSVIGDGYLSAAPRARLPRSSGRHVNCVPPAPLCDGVFPNREVRAAPAAHLRAGRGVRMGRRARASATPKHLQHGLHGQESECWCAHFDVVHIIYRHGMSHVCLLTQRPGTQHMA